MAHEAILNNSGLVVTELTEKEYDSWPDRSNGDLLPESMLIKADTMSREHLVELKTIAGSVVGYSLGIKSTLDLEGEDLEFDSMGFKEAGTGRVYIIWEPHVEGVRKLGLRHQEVPT